MPAKVIDSHTEGNQRWDSRFVLSYISLAILALLAGPAPLRAAEERETGPAVRQEAPFPTIVDAATAAGAPIRYQVLRGDFHMHTLHSDGKLSPADRVLEAWRYGYDAIAITDHGNFKAYAEALPVAKQLEVVLLRGMETGISEKEHLVALGFGADYEPRNSHRWAETEGQEQVFYQEQWRRLGAAGGFVLYPHPHVGLREQMLWAINQGLLLGIELKNDVVGSGWNTVESHGTHWYPSALTWAAEHNLAVFANSDVHGRRGDTVQPVTLVLATDRSPEAVMKAFRDGRTIAQFNGMLCGHEHVLHLLMAGLIDVRREKLPDGSTYVLLHNRGPVELTAEIADVSAEPVTVAPHQKVLARVGGTPQTLAVTWKNLYTAPTRNLTTSHRLTD